MSKTIMVSGPRQSCISLPNAPTIQSAVATSDGVVVTWNKVEGADYYMFGYERLTGDMQTWIGVVDGVTANLCYESTISERDRKFYMPLEDEDKYRFSVFVVNSAGLSKESVPVVCHAMDGARMVETENGVLIEGGVLIYANLNGVAATTVSDAVTCIGNWSFSECSSLVDVTIPASVTSIGTGAFSGCSGLASVTIPASVTSIGKSAFYSCSALTTVYVAPGDADRVKGLLVESGLDIDGITFENLHEKVLEWRIAFDSGFGDARYYQSVELGKVARLNPCTFVAPKGKRFAGWRRKDNGRRYDDGMLVFNLASEPGAVIVLEAVWENIPR